ncbi:MAG: biopolymer transporter ExbD [Lentisphaerae bacterium]|nr:biopolymer transporter ExbD [Lentisphaerota bacterium]
MKRLRRKRLEDIPVGSFADVAFLLIIFFILVTTLNKSKGFQTDLPSGETTQTTSAEKNPSIVLTGADILLDEQPVSLEKLEERLAALKLGELAKPENRIVILEAHAGVPYQDYYEIMATISHASGIVAIVKENIEGQ